MNPQPLHSVVIIGSGNVAEAFARTLRSSSTCTLRQLFARNSARGAEVARIGATEWCDDAAQLASADLYIIAVSDRAVAEIASQLSFPPHAAVVHTAGCVGIDALPAHIAHRGVIYPFQTFTQGRGVTFSELPLFIEASDSQLYAALDTFARALGCAPHPADSALRSRIHLAGVFACNFANDMFAVGRRVLADAGLPYEALRPLIRETAAKALASDDPTAVQTGPAVRGDNATQQRHRELLTDALLDTIYQSISKHIWETSKKI